MHSYFSKGQQRALHTLFLYFKYAACNYVLTSSVFAISTKISEAYNFPSKCDWFSTEYVYLSRLVTAQKA